MFGSFGIFGCGCGMPIMYPTMCYPSFGFRPWGCRPYYGGGSVFGGAFMGGFTGALLGNMLGNFITSRRCY